MEATKEATIPEEDARGMIRLLGDVAATPGAHEARKRILMGGICELIGGDYWVWTLAPDFVPGKPPAYASFLSGGFTEEQMPEVIVAMDSRTLEDALLPLGREVVALNAQITRSHADYDPEDVFHSVGVREPWEKADVDAPVMTLRPVSHDSLSVVAVYRRYGRAAFSEREKKIMDVLMSEVPWLHEQGWPWESALRVPELSNRSRITLSLMLEGLSRKQIADKMDISIHTVNDYIKSLYEFFSVHSHAELLNRFRTRVLTA